MEAAFKMLHLVVTTIEGIIGIIGSGFIVVINLLDVCKGRRLETCNLIIMALGVSSTCFQCILMGNTYIYFIRQAFANKANLALVLLQLSIWTGSANFWFTTCLCSFYCVKIVDFNHQLFFWLKLRISGMMPWMLLVSAMGSLVLSIPLYLNSEFPQNSTAQLPPVSNLKHGEVNSLTISIVVGGVIGFCLPLLLDIACVTCILISLYRHTQRMKKNASGFSHPRLEVHFGAVKMVGSLLLIFVLFLLAESFLLFCPVYWLEAIAWMFLFLSSASQSLALILGNTKLKQTISKVLYSCGK